MEKFKNCFERYVKSTITTNGYILSDSRPIYRTLHSQHQPSQRNSLLQNNGNLCIVLYMLLWHTSIPIGIFRDSSAMHVEMRWLWCGREIIYVEKGQCVTALEIWNIRIKYAIQLIFNWKCNRCVNKEWDGQVFDTKFSDLNFILRQRVLVEF